MKDINMCKKYLSENIRNIVMDKLKYAEEIRLRIGQNVRIKCFNEEICFDYKVSKEDIKEIYEKMTRYSVYAFKDEIKCGYITLEGGYRVGLAGSIIEEEGSVVGIKNISSLNIRIAREIKGCCESIINFIKGNVIIISPPCCGKTTLLRDIIRVWSDFGQNICVIDERNEISGSYCGISQLDVGKRTDVLVNVKKKNGFEMALRAMSPNVIAVDEIGFEDDITALKNALNCGVYILCTVHSYDFDILKKRGISKLVEEKVFDTYIFLNKVYKNRVEKICNKEMNVLWQGSY